MLPLKKNQKKGDKTLTVFQYQNRDERYCGTITTTPKPALFMPPKNTVLDILSHPEKKIIEKER